MLLAPVIMKITIVEILIQIMASFLHLEIIQLQQEARFPARSSRGLGSNRRKLASENFKLAKMQLKNKYWLVLFEDQTCSVVHTLSNNICAEVVQRLHIEVFFVQYLKFFVGFSKFFQVFIRV